MSGRFVAVVGPSGVGKDSVMEAVVAREPGLVLARRIITRPGDAGGERFDGVTEPEFERRKAAGQFALSWSAHGLQYAIPIQVQIQLQQGLDVLANLSRAALVEARAAFARFDVIHLTAAPDILAARLARRGRESAMQIADRLERASAGLPAGMDACEIDNSGSLEQTVRAVLDRLYPEQV